MSKIHFRKSLSVSELMQLWLKANKLSSQVNTRCVYHAWDDASGAGDYTAKRFFRDGKLYVTISSSVVRSQLYFQRAALLDRINELLRKDELYGMSSGTENPVKELIIK